MKDRKSAFSAVLIGLFLVLVAYYGTYCLPQDTPEPVAERLLPEATPLVFRLHILAHSDREEDQDAKLAVRDLVLTDLFTLNTQLISCEDAIEYARQRLDHLQNKIAASLARRGLDYGVKIAILQEEFPVTYYGEIRLPAGRYQSMKITLGEGKGRNWWCVLYPPLCFSDLNDGDTLTVMAEDKSGTIAGKRRPGLWPGLKENWRQELKKVLISQ